MLAETITHDDGDDEMMRVLELEGSTQVAKVKTTQNHAFGEHEYAVVPETSNFSPPDNDYGNDSPLPQEQLSEQTSQAQKKPKHNFMRGPRPDELYNIDKQFGHPMMYD